MIIKANMLNMLKVFHDEFKKLELAKNVEDGAQVNVIESISVNGVNQPVTNKNVALNLDAYAKKSELNILNTTPSTVEGKIWFEFENHQPILKIFYGGEVFALSGAVSYSQDGIYYFTHTGTNLIADLQPENMIILEDGLALVDAKFVTRNEYKDLVLTLGDGVTATICTTTASVFEHLDTQGRTLTFIDNDERRHPVTFYSDGRAVEGKSIMLTSDFADTAFDAGTFTTVKAVQSPISIQGGTSASVLISGGGNDTLAGNSGNDTFTGGAGADTYLFNGGDITISNYASGDKVSLTPGYTLSTYNIDVATSQSRLTIVDAQGNVAGYVTFDGLSENTNVNLWQTPDGANEPEVITEKFAQAFNFDNAAVGSAMAVTVKTNYGDFGVLTNNTNDPGTECYGSLKKIVATKPNSTLIGNKNANTFEIVGGENNVITGGLNRDYYVFYGGGGIITDFGINTLNDKTGKMYAKVTTQKATDSYYAYNRTDPTTYAEGNDILKVNGVVTKIVFSGYGDDTSKKNQTFNATVHYRDAEGNTHTVELQNIVKGMSAPNYKSDSSAAELLNIWDNRTGELAQLKGTTLTSLFRSS